MKIIGLFLFLSLSFSAFAGGPGKESNMVKGTVSDVANHESLAGVKVFIKGTNLSTYTDFDGNFSLIIPKGIVPELSFEMMSYETKSSIISSQNSSEIQISLQERN